MLKREDSKALISVLTMLAGLCLFFSVMSHGQSFVFDGSGRLKVNTSGSAVAATNATGGYLWTAITNQVVVANSNTFSFSIGNTVALPVSNSLANPYLWVSQTNTTANTGNSGVTNSAGTYLWTAQTNAIPAGSAVIGAVTQSGTWNIGSLTTFPDNEPFNVAQVGGFATGTALPVTNVPSAVYWSTLTNSTANIGNVGVTNSVGTYLWTAMTNAIPTGANVIGAVTQSGTWDEVGINDSGNSITVDASNLDVQIGGSDTLTIGTFPDNEPINVAQVGGLATGSALPVTNVVAAVYWSTLTNSTANAGNFGATNSAGTYLWVAQTNLIAQTDATTNLLTQLTNYLSPATVKIAWNPAAGFSSNLASSTPITLTWLSVINTNTATVQLTAYDSASVPNLGTASGYSWAVPYATNGAGFVISIPGGQRFTAGLAFWVTAGGGTNAASGGPIFVNGGGKP